MELALVILQYGPFAARLDPYFKSWFCNNLIDLPFQSSNDIEFHSPLLLVLFALRNHFSLFIYICILLVRSVLVMNYITCFRVLLASVILELLSSKIGVRVVSVA